MRILFSFPFIISFFWQVGVSNLSAWSKDVQEHLSTWLGSDILLQIMERRWWIKWVVAYGNDDLRCCKLLLLKSSDLIARLGLQEKINGATSHCKSFSIIEHRATPSVSFWSTTNQKDKYIINWETPWCKLKVLLPYAESFWIYIDIFSK